MTFIRAKEIPPRSGNWYDYEVETVHEGGRARQKVVRYLGRSATHLSLPILLTYRTSFGEVLSLFGIVAEEYHQHIHSDVCVTSMKD